MSGKYIFDLTSKDRRRDLPRKIIIGQSEVETTVHVLLKFLAFVLLYRERIQMGIDLHNDTIPFRPDLVQLDYELRPRLWVECGDCTVAKLDKLAVKVPDAEIWVFKRSAAEVESLIHQMRKGELRRDRYWILHFDAEMVDELAGLLTARNALVWVTGDFEPPHLQFDFNGLWFDAEFQVVRF